MNSRNTSYDAMLAERLDELAMPENQGEGLLRRDFLVLLSTTILLPLVALGIGWLS